MDVSGFRIDFPAGAADIRYMVTTTECDGVQPRGVRTKLLCGGSVAMVRAGLFGWAMVFFLASGISIAQTTTAAADGDPAAETPTMQDVKIHHWKTVPIPMAFLSTAGLGEEAVLPYGGDIRIGDLRNQQTMDLLVYRSAPGASRHGGVKPVFLGAFDQDGNELWSVGSGGVQPARPGPVAIHDLDGDGREEVVTYNPWDNTVHIYGSMPAPASAITGYIAGPGQYNARLMD